MLTTLAFFNLQSFLETLLNNHLSGFYIIVIFIIFIETGLVIFPFLPGDSLLFFSGSLAALATNHLSILVLIPLLTMTTILANTINYQIGKHFGKKISQSKIFKKLIKQKHLDETEIFFKKHGAMAIFLGKFMPIIRTIVPFTAGIGKMNTQTFSFFNITGSITWILITILSGYFFGNITFVKNHFEIIMLAIIFISLLPAAIVFLRQNRVNTNLE
ncbi:MULTISPECIES: VTT domain-containing protein [unclassified Enterococcus]|uniref:VTT domain-containing protein n=1 Tax=unclassified Enterococcus TaxID=2608891 RepID=UPI001553C45B|nr:MULTISPECIES: VTT domain-containing protein [unclassified Enterococcus]MBS7576010.1 VTT domain-containing protein [Enterococcus sp. MMGLQ5-2]MBS7583243.1 VTT domain-containing protein [Enterococcus sp. MMGLQ5-1]NPD11103.1 cytochrome O ubiquinol oxidase [Enterococcus sp. MMGLQ5-1]NPD35846.1 cytochrome O ubiquinol oxidase [Enterococcus sp. MMGLQ5-2]